MTAKKTVPAKASRAAAPAKAGKAAPADAKKPAKASARPAPVAVG